jgi:hypothetical protein
MGRTLAIILICCAAAISALAAPQAAPQNARQALLEMFFSKTAGTFEKHLPEALRAALRKADNGGGPSALQQFSLLTSQLNAMNGQLQTFEAGPTLLVAENLQQGSRFEIVVEHDDLRGDEDEIELSFRSFKNGQAQNVPVFPKLTFLMKSQAGVWRLNELTLAIRVALDDPDFVKTIITGMQQRQMRSSMPTEDPSPRPAVPANDTAALGSLRTILTAETQYAINYPRTGYTCSLSDLDGFGGGTPNEHQAMLIESRLASGKKNGYVFTLSGCDGPPAAHFRLTAVPAMLGMGLRAFCGDEAGSIRTSADGRAATCLESGAPLQ